MYSRAMFKKNDLEIIFKKSKRFFFILWLKSYGRMSKHNTFQNVLESDFRDKFNYKNINMKLTGL